MTNGRKGDIAAAMFNGAVKPLAAELAKDAGGFCAADVLEIVKLVAASLVADHVHAVEESFPDAGGVEDSFFMVELPVTIGFALERLRAGEAEVSVKLMMEG